MIGLVEVVLFFTVFTCIYVVKNRKPKNAPPGFLPLPFLSYNPLIYFLRPYSYHVLKIVQRFFGEVFNIYVGSDDIVYVRDYEFAKEALKHPDMHGRPFNWSINLMTFGKKCGMSFSEGEEQVKIRKFAVHSLKNLGFTKSKVHELAKREMVALIESWKKQLDKPVPVTKDLVAAVSNITWGLVAGYRFSPEDSEGQKAMAALHPIIDTVRDINLYDVFPSLLHILPNFITKIETLKEKKEIFGEFFMNLIKERERTLDRDNPQHLMDAFLSVLKDDDKMVFSYESVLSVLGEFIVAGTDTTSGLSRLALPILASHPEIQRKLQKEIFHVVGEFEDPTTEHRKSMPYMEAFINELMRTGNVLPCGVPHMCTRDSNVKGYHISKGQMLIMDFVYIHTSTKYWKNPTVFDPERFLDEDGAVQYKKDGFMPFSLGKRACPGDQTGRMVLFINFTNLLRNFSFHLQPGQKCPPIVSREYNKGRTPVEMSLIVTDAKKDMGITS